MLLSTAESRATSHLDRSKPLGQTYVAALPSPLNDEWLHAVAHKSFAQGLALGTEG